MNQRNRIVSMRRLSAAIVLAGMAALPLAAFAQNAFNTPDNSFSGRVRVNQPEPVYAGSSVSITGSNFKAGQLVTLERGQAILNSQPYVVDEKGDFSAKIDIPANAVVGMQPVVVKVSGPDAAVVFDLKISPRIELLGQDKYQIKSVQPAKGLYQSAYSAKNNALFVTSTAGRPPIKDSQLVRLNPQTLAVEASIQPAQVDERSGVYAVYGVGVDDRNETVWVTNTRQNTVAVYNQKDLSLVKQLPPGLVPSGRDVVVDSDAGKVYVSSTGTGSIYVLDVNKQELLAEIAIKSKVPRGAFKSMSLAFDAKNKKLYTVSLTSPEVASINTSTGEVEAVYNLPGLLGGSGVAVDAQGKRLFVVGSQSDSLWILNAENGQVLHHVAVGAGPLNVAYNAQDGLAYVANRGSGTVAAVSKEGKMVANLSIGPNVNHISIDQKGHVFITNKAQGEDPRSDQVTRLERKR